jgi:hypothetical protein
MFYKSAITSLFLGAFLFAPAVSTAGDIDEIKAQFELAVQGYNEVNAEKVHANSHDEWVGFGPAVPFASESKAAALNAVGSVFSATESIVLVPVGVQFRVIGGAGIVWGHYILTMKPKDGPTETTSGRFLNTLAKVGGKWFAISSQITPISLGQ